MKKYKYFPILYMKHLKTSVFRDALYFMLSEGKMYHWYDFENKRRGSYSFPIEYHYVTSKHPRFVMPFHWHHECEFIRVLEGSFKISVASTNYVLKSGNILYVPNNFVHGGIPDNCVYECIVFDFISILQNSSFSDKYYSFFTHKKEIKKLYDENCQEVVELINKLFDVVKNRNEGWQINTVGCLFQFLGVVSENHYFLEIKKDDSNLGSLYIERFESVFNLIRSKYSEVITLDDMAKAAGMSPKYFCHMFKQLTHYTPIEYLLNYRIEFAKHLLRTKKMQVSDVSIKTGFNSTAYFIKVFKKITGITPKKYINATDIQSNNTKNLQ